MSQVKEFITRCAAEMAGIVHRGDMKLTRLVLHALDDPDRSRIRVVVESSRGQLKLTMTNQSDPTKRDIVQQVSFAAWLASAVVINLPQSLFAEEAVAATFTGEHTDASPIMPLRGNSASGEIIEGKHATDLMDSTTSTYDTIARLLDLAVLAALEHVTSGDKHTAQICVLGLAAPVWMNIDASEDAAGTYLLASTNDMDLSVGSPPSFCRREHDSGMLGEAIFQDLMKRFSGVTTGVSAKVLRRSQHGPEHLLVGRAESDKLHTVEERVAI